ncbi:2-C-methyl-D-erythritol 4-phosphate cytidylyltransferase [Schaalia sp. Marseille-Q2122]|uniref:IspD/TarI family cytidylyltransferase n=1 Tax=Schaalia sp. Marseille-Q2122 TaxID=2736604 RepID=UPI0020CA73D0|nr:2-C-methyl-D-erythritol 4-phosphate cytidylyltransferase [Schaalia sp. Marseille-Q2122]
MAALPALAQRHGLTLEDASVVLVHDAARCLTPAVMIRRVIDAVERGCEAVIPALAVTDTVKQVASEEELSEESASERALESRYVVATPDRSALVSVQTPQGFRWATLQAAHEAGRERAAHEGTAATDDASLVEAMGGRVHVVDGDGMAMKITTSKDLIFIEATMKVLSRRREQD